MHGREGDGVERTEKKDLNKLVESSGDCAKITRQKYPWLKLN
jgi:hypothetical protein